MLVSVLDLTCFSTPEIQKMAPNPASFFKISALFDVCCRRVSPWLSTEAGKRGLGHGWGGEKRKKAA